MTADVMTNARPQQFTFADDPRWSAAGVTYRRLDVWTTRGYLRVDQPHPGSGYVRRFPVEEIAVAARMVRLTDAGLNVAKAAEVARAEYPVELAPGIFLTVTDTTGKAA